MDQRLVVEQMLREEGLLGKNRHASKYLAEKIMQDLTPPTRPRPEMTSQVTLGEC